MRQVVSGRTCSLHWTRRTAIERNDRAMTTEGFERWTRLLVIDYSDNGRYHEHLFNRTIRDGSMVYIDTAGKEFDDSLLGRCSHVCGVPNYDKLYRYVLKDGTIVTTGDAYHADVKTLRLRTYDDGRLLVPVSNLSYVIEIE